MHIIKSEMWLKAPEEASKWHCVKIMLSNHFYLNSYFKDNSDVRAAI